MYLSVSSINDMPKMGPPSLSRDLTVTRISIGRFNQLQFLTCFKNVLQQLEYSILNELKLSTFFRPPILGICTEIRVKKSRSPALSLANRFISYLVYVKLFKDLSLLLQFLCVIFLQKIQSDFLFSFLIFLVFFFAPMRPFTKLITT